MALQLTPAGMRRLAALAVGAALLYGAFEYGRSLSGYSALSSLLQRQALDRRIGALTAERDQLRQRVTASAVTRQVDAEAQSEVQAMLGEQAAELSRLQQELDFYRGLVAEKFGAGTLKIQEVTVRPADGTRYTVLVTMVHTAARNTTASGWLSLAVAGERGNSLARLAMADIAPESSPRVEFSLRYYTTLEVPVTLPEGFTPASIELEYRSNRSGPDPIRQSFPWSGVLAGEPEAALTPDVAPE